MDRAADRAVDSMGWLRMLAATTAVILAAALLGQALLRMPADELRQFVAYLAVSGLATSGLAVLVRRRMEATAGLTLAHRLVVGVGIAAFVGVLNVLGAAQLMFISTGHDLPLLLSLLLFGSLLTILFTLSTVSQATEGMDRVSKELGELAAGNYGARLPLHGGREVRRLAADVNKLAERLEEARRQHEAVERERRQLTVAVSHDLRTPLASIRAMVEALADGIVKDPDERARYYRLLRGETDRLSGLLDDLFDLSRLDAGAFRLDLALLPLEEVVSDVVDAMQRQAEQRAVTLALTLATALPSVPADGTQMQRVTANLIRNALEHTPAGGRIDVSLDACEDGVRLRVSDTGEGIAHADMERIWERFYRGESSRHRSATDDGGSGLGLAIVRGLVEAHGGQVAVESKPGERTTFTVSLPAGRTGRSLNVR